MKTFSYIFAMSFLLLAGAYHSEALLPDEDRSEAATDISDNETNDASTSDSLADFAPKGRDMSRSVVISRPAARRKDPQQAYKARVEAYEIRKKVQTILGAMASNFTRHWHQSQTDEQTIKTFEEQKAQIIEELTKLKQYEDRVFPEVWEGICKDIQEEEEETIETLDTGSSKEICAPLFKLFKKSIKKLNIKKYFSGKTSEMRGMFGEHKTHAMRK